MKKRIYVFLVHFLIIFCALHLIAYYFSRHKAIIDKDLDVWCLQLDLNYSRPFNLSYLLIWHREYRNLFYYRIKNYDLLLRPFLPKLASLHLNAKFIGPGFFIQHGESSRINGEYIGANCWVNQDVAIAFSNKYDRPTLHDNVKVHTGAKVIGKVTIGENSIIGANAVIVKDVPKNCTVVGVYPAFIVKKDGEKVRIPL